MSSSSSSSSSPPPSLPSSASSPAAGEHYAWQPGKIFDPNNSTLVSAKNFHEARDEVKLVCDPAVKLFANCCKDRLVSIIWACKEEKQAMDLCIKTEMAARGFTKDTIPQSFR